jgi:hypothetical protein
LDFFADKVTPKAIRLQLRTLRKESEAPHDDNKPNVLDYAYTQVMKRIEGQEVGYKNLAKEVLSWITYAKRPLTKLELQHALAVVVNNSRLDEDELLEIEDIVSVCAGLVTIDETSDIIRFSHITMKEYFQRTRKSWFPEAETDIANICITYLSFDTFGSGVCLTDKEFEARLGLYPLYAYAATHWADHARTTSRGEDQLILGFLSSEDKVFASNQAMRSCLLRSDSGYSQRMPTHITGLHLAAYLGLKTVVEMSIMKEHDPIARDLDNRTPLWWATEKGHQDVMKILILRDRVTFQTMMQKREKILIKSLLNVACTDIRDFRRRTLLHVATLFGDLELATDAISSGVDITHDSERQGILDVDRSLQHAT